MAKMLQSSNFLKSWKRNETAALIALFESEKLLYDNKHPDYYNPEERHEAYSRILDILQRVDTECTLSQIKRKLRFLLSKYSTEKRRKMLALISGKYTEKNYKPALWYFSLLNFLSDFSPPYVCRDDYRKLDTETTKETKVPKIEKPKVSAKDDSNMIMDDNGQTSEETSNSFPNDSDSVSSVTQYGASSANGRNPKEYKQPESGFENGYEGSTNNSNGVNHTKRTLHENRLQDKNKAVAQKVSMDEEGSECNHIKKVQARKPADREDIFGQYIATEIKTLRDNPLLYLQTKHAILGILSNANFELLNPE